MARKYRKRPHVIEAMQWTGDNLDAIRDWAGTDGIYGPIERTDQLTVTKITGDPATVRVGDWILPEPQPGRFSPCPPDIFETLYEPMED
jgi:hypothetical protein